VATFQISRLKEESEKGSAMSAQTQLYVFLDLCPFCGSDECETIRREAHAFPKGNRYFDPYRSDNVALRRCNLCEFAFVDKLPRSDEFFAKLYNNGVWTNRDWSAEFLYNHKQLILREARKCILRYCHRGTLLDVGTRTGVFLHLMSDHFRVRGVEVDESAVVFARSKGLDVVSAPFLKADFGSERFDVITYIDVLEHLPEPRRVLERSIGLLNPHGLLYIKVPNYRGQIVKQDLLNRLRLSTEGVCENYVHINHFTRWSLSRQLERLGLKVLEAGFTAPELLSVTQPNPVRVRLKRLTSQVAYRSITRALNSFAKVTGRELGLNVYVLARKEPCVVFG